MIPCRRLSLAVTHSLLNNRLRVWHVLSSSVTHIPNVLANSSLEAFWSCLVLVKIQAHLTTITAQKSAPSPGATSRRGMSNIKHMPAITACMESVRNVLVLGTRRTARLLGIRLSHWSVANGVISPAQTGFVVLHGCEYQILTLLEVLRLS